MEFHGYNIESQFEQTVNGFPNQKRRTSGFDYHNEFNIIVKNGDDKRAVFKFYGSYHDYEKGITVLSDDQIKDAFDVS